MGVGDQRHATVALPTAQEAGWASGRVWMGVENVPTGIRCSDPPARKELLYQLSYPGTTIWYDAVKWGHSFFA